MKAQCPEIGRVSLGSGHWSTCCPTDSSFQKVYTLALSPQLAPEGKARSKCAGSGAGGYTFPHPALPPPPGRAQDESGRARGSPPASQLYRLLAGEPGLHRPPHARRAQRTGRGLQGHSPPITSPGDRAGAGPAARQASCGEGGGEGEAAGSPTALPDHRGSRPARAPPGRGPHIPAPTPHP